MRRIQILLLLNWTYITIGLWIVNIILYNIAHCSDVPETVAEWVAKYDPKDSIEEEVNSLGIIELIHRRQTGGDIGVWLEDIPHRASKVTTEPVVDKNEMHEQDASAEGSDIPSTHLPSEAEGSNIPLTTKIDPNHPLAFVTEKEYQVIAQYHITIMDHAIAILNTAYPDGPVDDIPDASLKNAAYIAVKNHGNQLIYAQAEADVMNNHHISNVYIAVLQSILNNPELELTPNEMKLLTHMGTCMTLINGANAHHLDDEQLVKLIHAPFYEGTFRQFQINTHQT